MPISERQYKNAVATINEYRAQQKELEKNKVYTSGITLATTLKELMDNKLITPRLYYKLEQIYKSEYAYSIKDTPLDPYIGFFIETRYEDVAKWYGVGKGMKDEFVTLMAAAGHEMK
jgi:hypothetical protein